MTEPLQPGSHLSADQLSAFAENALPDHERLAALAHLADCVDCRKTVFLIQQSDPTLAATSPAAETPRSSWFTLPQIFTAAGAALACSLILTLIVHHHHDQFTAAPVATAQLQQPPVLAPSPAVTAPAPNPAQPKPAANKSAQLTPATTHPLPIEPAKLTPAPQPLPAKLAPHAVQLGTPGTGYSMEPKQKYADVYSGSTVFGATPPAPQTPIAGVSGGVPKPAPPPPQPYPYSVHGIDKFDSYSVAANAPAALPPAPPTATNVAASGQSADSVQRIPLAGRAAPSAAVAKSATLPLQLPSKLPAASVLHSSSRTLALDTAGALFLSLDNGKHWTAVISQWPGKAVQISLAPSPLRLYLQQPSQSQAETQSGNSVNGLPQQQSPIPTAGFELTTNTGAVFVSTDGLTWRAR